MRRKTATASSQDSSHDVPLAAIREVSERDLPRLRAMYADFQPKESALGLPPATEGEQDRWLRAMLRTGFNFVAEREGELVAHLVLIRVGDLANMAIFVHQDYRRRGIGTALLQVALEQARDMGLRQVLVTLGAEEGPVKEGLVQAGFIVSRETEAGTELVLTL